MSEMEQFFDNKMNEECGVFGVFNHEDAQMFTYYALHSLQHRGQEGTGIVTSDNNHLLAYKNEGLVKDVFNQANLTKIKGIHAIGHVRYATAGGGGIMNVQPFLFRSHDGDLGLCHNGNLVNADLLKRELESTGSIFQTTSDSEIVAHLIKRCQGTFTEKLICSLNQLEGAFAFLFLHKDRLFVALDKKGLRPLSIGKLNGAYFVSSETCAFNVLGIEFIRDVKPGEILEISSEGIKSTFYTDEVEHNICSMEYIYFSRPDSDIEGINVHYARKRSGALLAEEHAIDADIVIGVPDSGISAAVGYSEKSGIPFEMGLIKNKYSGRTFIEPTKELRDVGVKMKLSAVPSIVKDKRVIVIDDSIVRGTTSKRLIKMLREAGAKEVHMRISSPEIKFPCFYGVDFSTYDELISSKLSVKEIAEVIDADTLGFLSLEGLKQAVGRSKNLGKNCGQCVACFNGDYPTSLYNDVKEANKNIK